MLKKILFIFLTLVSLQVFSQFNPPNPSVPSSNIGKQSLEISNDLYNGRINISFPILKYSFEGVDFPISISYSGNNGLKPDQLPSWVGAGWDLNAGGYITRTVRGKPDEMRDFEKVIYTPINYNRINPSTPVDKQKTTLYTENFSYFNKSSILGNIDWSNPTFIGGFRHPNTPIYSGDPYYTITTYNPAPLNDLVPDEFSFSIGGISGKFYLNHLNEWVVQSNDGQKYSVDVVSGELITADFTSRTQIKILEKVPNLIKYIVLTSTDGIKYYFGNEDVNAPFNQQYFEFSQSSILRFIPDRNTDNYTKGDIAATLIDVVPHTWHLTKIENIKTNSIISFNYKESFQFSTTRQAYGYGIVTGGAQGGSFVYKNYHSKINENSIFSEPLSAVSRVLTRTWALTSINFPNGVKIQFESSPSEQQSTNHPIDQSLSWFNTSAFKYYGSSGNNSLLQLNKIIVSFSENLKNEILFKYKLSNSQRLQLEYFATNYRGHLINKYSFEYDSTVKLPEYGSGKNDHWGFFNNRDFFESVPPDLNQDRYTFTAISNYSNYRQPDANYSIAEILKRIQYPEGGSVEFEYEQNDYSKKRKSAFDFSIENTNSNLLGGGVRIKSVNYFSSEGTEVNSKSFKYGIPGTSSFSSGVLGILPQRYLIQHPQSESFMFQASGYNGTYYGGNPITYTYAEEIYINNGKKLYQYTNYDNGYSDLAPLSTNINAESSFQFDYAYQNNSFKRGKLISEKIFTETGLFPIKETKYHYEHDNSENNKKEVRSIYLDPFSGSGFAAVSERIYPNHIISVEELNYEGESSISSKIETTYDDFGNITKKSVQNSSGKILVTRYTYPYEYPLNTPSPFFPMRNRETSREMVNKNIISYPIETVNSIIENNIETVTGGQLQKFFTDPLTGIISLFSISTLEIDEPISDFIPSSIQLRQFLDDFLGSYSDEYLKRDSRYAEKIFYDKYDAKGNVLQYHLQGGSTQSFLWDYNNIYQIAEVKNAAQADIAATSFEADGKGNWIFNGIPSAAGGSITGTQSYLLSSGKEIKATGLTSTKKYIISYWSKGSVTVTGGSQSNFSIGREVNGWIYHEVTITGTGSVTLGGNSYIDELRLYPSDAQMITYTYEPLVGSTSQCDANNRITYYEYDGFGRLSIIRDQDNNILKKICYNYAGQPENCDCTNFDPVWQNTSTPLRCRIYNNANTGEQEQEQKDTNPCSPTYNQLKWITIGENLIACPNCNYSNCDEEGEGKRCINGICETGIQVFTGSHKEGPWTFCDYHYEWSDGSWSEEYSVEVPPGTICGEVEK